MLPFDVRSFGYGRNESEVSSPGYRVKRGKTEHLHSTDDYEARNKSNNFIF